MAYLSDFENDLFISYARLNNQPEEAGAEGWVTRFHARLENELKQLTGRDLKIWRDLEDLERNQLFDVTIRNAVERSAMLIVINSLSWKNSNYCQEEARWFGDRAQQDGWGIAIGDRKRTFNIRFNNIPYTEWHPVLSGANPYNFFEAESEDDVGFPCEPESDIFKKELRTLVRNLFNTLRAFKVAQENRKQPAPNAVSVTNGNPVTHAASANGAANGNPPEKAAATIFLAGTSDTLRKTRQRLVAELHDKGIALADEVPPPWDAAAHESNVTAEIQRAQLCVHLFDAWPGREIEEQPEQFYTHRQVQLAQAQSKPQLIWVAPSLDLTTVEDDKHRTLLTGLETGPRESTQHSFVRESPTQLAQLVLAQLAAQQQTSEQTPTGATVLLDTHLKDDDYTFEFRNVLRQLEIRAYINQTEADPRSNIEILEKRLRQVNQMVLVFGNVSEDWVWGRLFEALRFDMADRRLQFFIYYARRNKENQGQFKLGARTIYELDDSDLRNPQSLKQQLNRR
jgi:hypothetical protein